MCGGWGAALKGGLRRGGTRLRGFAALFAVAAAALVGVPSALATVVTIPVEADTYVSQTTPDANFGDSSFFDVYGGKNLHCLPAVDYSAPAYGLLRFPLGTIPAGRQLVDARVYTTTRTGFAQDGDPYHHLIYLPNDGWSESTVTFNTKPSDGTVAPGDPHLAAFPGTDIRSSVFEVGAADAFRTFPCGEDPHHLGDVFPFFPDPASASFKTPAAAEKDLLAHMAADRANSDDGKISFEVYTPNCPVCPAGNNTAYWGRYVSKEDATRTDSAPRLVVTYADISTQASATTPTSTGGQATYSVTFTNDASSAITLSSVNAQLPPGFTYVANSSSANLHSEPTVDAGIATWNAVAADLAPGQKLDVSFKLKASDTPGSYDTVVSGSTGFESPFAVGSATASVDVQPAAPTANGDSKPVLPLTTVS